MTVVTDVLAALAGAVCVAIAVSDLFQSVIVPRAIGGRWRPTAMLGRYGWHLWRDAALRINDVERREDTMGVFAPAMLVALLIYWIAAQVIGYGLIFWALRTGVNPPLPNLGSAIYFAGTSLLTIGYGDFAPQHLATRALAMISAVGGLTTFAIVTTFWFQTFGAFQRREAFVVAVSERAGAPPSGVEFLERHIKLGLMDDAGAILRDAQNWIAEVMETHLAYPALTYFRSSHDDESWIGTLGALLDASTLLITTVDLPQRGQAEITLRLGSHLVRDFTHFFNVPAGEASGVEYDEFVVAYRTLRELGVPMHPLEDAWPAFSSTRAQYAVPLDAMARWWRIPPARWIGDRSRIRSHVNVGTMVG